MNRPVIETKLAFSTFVEVLQTRAQHQPDRLAYTFQLDDEGREESLTYEEMDRRARAIAALLQAHGAAGKRVLLLYPAGADYISAYFGCLYAGDVAVPAYPPSSKRLMPRLQAVVEDSNASVVLTTEGVLGKMKNTFLKNSDLEGLEWITTDQLQDGLENEWQDPGVTPDMLAFLQYTSGSTSLPKGVMVTHGNLIHNSQLIHESFQTMPDDIGVFWLPPYHDMGLIGGLLQPMYVGFHAMVFSPFDFMQRPLRWLELISNLRATVSGGPNFAYDLVADKITDEVKNGLDLSSWKTAFNGAEPVREETLERFAETFRECGFRKEAFYPCYGLAEGTLFVTGGEQTALPVVKRFHTDALESSRRAVLASGANDELRTRVLVGSGQTRVEQQVLIVNTETLVPCPEGEVGEIWVRGDSVAKGYWNRPQQTEETFRASLSTTGEGPFLRTGDLGFLLEGELFVTGRLKDLIIIRGRNYYPQDIELTIERSHPAIRPSATAAFAIDVEGDERLVVVQELDRHHKNADLEEVITSIRQAVAEEHGVSAYAVVLLKFASIPKTSSGKIQRHACRNGFLDDTLNVLSKHVLDEGYVAEEQGGGPEEFGLTPDAMAKMSRDELAVRLEDYLQAALSRELKMPRDQVDKSQPISVHGIDSLMAVQLQNRIEGDLDASLSAVLFLQGPSIAEVAATLIETIGQEKHVLRSTDGQDAEGDHALSRGQQALWFLQKFTPGSAAYNVSRAVRIVGELEREALRQAFGKMIERHVALRTTFPAGEKGMPIQRVHAECDADYVVEPADSLSEAELKSRLNEEAYRPFDLEHGPLMRLRLFQRSEHEHVLLWSFHHIITDFWSLDLLVTELGALYSDMKKGSSSLLPLPDMQYTDYVRWQEQSVARADGQAKLAYWTEKLSGELPVLNLPTDRPRPPVQTYRGASAHLKLSLAETKQLKELSRTHGATLYMTLLAAYGVLLHRNTGQDDVIVGSPLSSRTRTDMQSMIGYVTNAMPLRLDLANQPDFATVLQRVRETVLGALQHQDYPFDLVVENLHIERDSSRSPIFQTQFVMQNIGANNKVLAPFALGIDGPTMNLGDLVLESVGLEERTSQFDLTLYAAEVDGELGLTFQYNTDLFDASTITRMLTHFQSLLSGIASGAEQKVALLPLLSAEERQQLLVDWNDTEKQYQPHESLHQLFRAQVQRTPDAIAVTFDDQNLTYRELNERVNRLAHYLQTQGVGANTRVGVCMERSVEMVVALYGILKAGGSYVPIDPTYPGDRIAYMLEDSDVTLLLTQQPLVSQLPAHGKHTLCLDAEWDIVASESAEEPVSTAGLDDVAYMIYTSGSTGKPKGVKVPHKGICNRLLWMQEAYQLTAEDVVLQKTPFSFDVSVWEFFWPLLTGARLVVVKPEGHKDSAYLVRLIKEQKVTTLHFVPSMLQVFLEEAGVETCTSLRQVMCSGEALPFGLTERFFAKLPARLHNLYGPTEASVDVTHFTCEPNSGWKMVPIGRPISNIQMYVLDEHLQPVPIGVAGELHIGGIGLAKEYHNRPDLTAEKFITNPFGQTGERLYKTGDLARYLPSGHIEYLGRIDFQVKIRGFRIELGEIENVITQHPNVREAVVMAREDLPGGDKRLVAYVVLHQEANGAIEDIRAYLKTEVPEYMVPSFFVILEEMPLSPNGKADRKQLPKPLTDTAANYVEPTNEKEFVLVEIWSQVIGISQVGITDNFFSIGGDSIRAIKVVSLAKERGLPYTLQQIFEHQTVRDLAQAVPEGAEGQDAEVAIEPFALLSEADRAIVPAGAEDVYPLAAIQASVVFHSEFNDDYQVYVSSYRVRIPFEQELFDQAIDRMVQRHEIMRTSLDLNTFTMPMQIVHKEAVIRLAVEDLREMSPEQQDAYFEDWHLQELRRPFDWSRPGLFRFTAHRLTDDVFQFTMAEPFLDGWSVATTTTELFTEYTALVAGGESGLQAPNSKYRTYIAMEQSMIQSADVQAFWDHKLADCTVTPLHRWPNGAKGNDLMKDRHWVPISEEVSGGLRQLAQSTGVPLKNVLLAAHLKVVSLLSGQSDVISGLVMNGRPEEQDAEKVIGIFLNTLPLRMNLEGGTWEDLVRQAFEAERELLPNRRYPLNELQKRHGGGKLLFETSFNYTHFHVYQGLDKIAGLEVIDARHSDYTYIDMTAQFTVDVNTSNVLLALDYLPTKIGEDQLEAIAEYYSNTLTSMANDPTARYEQQCLLSEAERTKQLVEWNDTQADDVPYEQLMHRLFEAQVEKTPDAVAISSEGQSITYAELNRKANQLARHLQKHGVGPDKVVAIYADRSIDFVLAILGTFKAGGAYVPLDPGYPLERSVGIVESAGAELLLTMQALAPDMAGRTGRVLCLDRDWEAIAAESSENVATDVTPDHLAYVIFTSGSTGKPKGAMIEHRGMVNHLFAKIKDLGLTERDIVAQNSSQCFDISVWQFLAALLVGGQVVIYNDEVAFDYMELIDSVVADRITILEVVPTLLRQMLEEIQMRAPQIPDMSALRYMIPTGEALFAELVHAWLGFYPNTPCVNTYGATECSDDTSHLFITEQPRPETVPMPLGYPVVNMRHYVLDKHLQPLPFCVPGEMHIAGIGVGRGYLNDPERTAKVFLSDPFDNRAGAKIYRTGDLVRLLPDGTFEFLGRIDNQVKINGFRIELGEIEATLGTHPAISQVVVSVFEVEGSVKRIVAYLILEKSMSVEVEELRAHVKQALPDYMMPSFFMFLDEFPLNMNGKIDRKALPKPDVTEASTAVYVEPVTETERKIAQIWGIVLGYEKVGLKDEFFERGGQSLLATQLISRVRKTFHVELPLRVLFEDPTVEGLVLIVNSALQEQVGEDDLTALLDELENLSDEEVAKLLSEE